MLRSGARRRRDADASAHRPVARPHHRRRGSRPASVCRRAVTSRNRSTCRATPSRLRSSNWPRKAISPFPPGAVRRWPRACRSIAARCRRGPAPERPDEPVGLGARACSGRSGRRYTKGGLGRFSRDWRMNASFRTICGAAACGARRGTPCRAATGPSTIRRCRKRCWRISRFIAASRPSRSQILIVPTAQAGLALVAGRLARTRRSRLGRKPGLWRRLRRLQGRRRRRLRDPARRARHGDRLPQRMRPG